MPDISMCTNLSCPSKETCYRFKAIPNEFWQSYFTFVLAEEETKCNSYIKIENYERKRTNTIK